MEFMYFDAHTCQDVWVEKLTSPIHRAVHDITSDDVEIDGTSILRYHGVVGDSQLGATVRVKYDAVYSDADIEDSQWREIGQWGRDTKIVVDARVVYMIEEEPEL